MPPTLMDDTPTKKTEAPSDADNIETAARPRSASTQGMRLVSTAQVQGDMTPWQDAQLGQNPMPGRYILGERLAKGGMGSVWEGTQTSLARVVAIKTPLDESEPVMEAIVREARILSRLEHPNVVPVFDLARDERNAPILVMRKIEGTSWSSLLKNPANPLWRALEVGSSDRLEASLRVLMRICGALSVAHRAGIIHRDIKPSNVMIDDGGEVYLVDWGIALELATDHDEADDSPAGTPGYMAPEMANPEVGTISVRTDVYLLGSTLHYILTGQARHVGSTGSAVLRSIVSSERVNYGPLVPHELAEMCNRAMAREPRDRFDSVDAFRESLGGFLARRAALGLLLQADEKLDLLISAAKDGKSNSVHVLGIECRFAYRAVLSQWADSQAAKAGLSRCLHFLLSYEIEQGNAAGARALYTELNESSPTLAAKIGELEQKQELAKQALVDRDVGLAAKGHLAVIRTAAVVWVLLILGLVGARYAWLPSPLPIVRYTAAPASLVCVLVVLLCVRRQLFAVNEAAKNGLILIMSASLWIAGFRGITVLLGDVPLESVMWIEALTAFAFLVLARVILRRPLWASLALAAMGSAVQVLVPAVRPYAFALPGLAIVVVAAEVLMRRSKPKSA